MIVTTIHGDMDDSLLDRRVYRVETEDEATDVVEYWLDGEIVHRSVHVTLKHAPIAFGSQGGFRG